MSKVLILGATGNIGGLTIATLTEHHPEVSLRLASSRQPGRDKLRELYPAAEIVSADWLDLDSLIPAVAGVDKLFIVTPDFLTDETAVTPNLIRAVRVTGRMPLIVRLIAIPPGLTAQKLTPEVVATRCGAALHTIAKPLLDTSGLPVTYINVPCWMMFNLPWFLANEIRTNKRLAMPESSDAPRQWISEHDVAAVAAKVLAEDPQLHAGKEYIINGAERYDYRQQADLLSEVLGERIAYVDDDRALREVMGPCFDAVMVYFTQHEARDYREVRPTDTVLRLLGRPPVTLREYVSANKSLFA
jgi:uncharacterized protein YbjT (DUF2867 family)